jgi:hypothetical protein
VGEKPLLRLVQGGLTDLALDAGRAPDVWRFEADCIQALAATWVARGFAATTISAYTSLLPRVLAHFDRPVWQIEPVGMAQKFREVSGSPALVDRHLGKALTKATAAS